MEIFRKELEVALEMLNDAKLLLNEKRFRSAVNRAYYAMMHSTKALLTLLDIEAISHPGIIRKFGQEVVQKGIMNKRYAKSLSAAYNMRDKSDYKIMEIIKDEKVDEVIKESEEFVFEIQKVIEMKIKSGSK
ncbi:MAG: HEPN domain-containing protein [bacterium]|nr:HEPN domain-containing protein [bacterium]